MFLTAIILLIIASLFFVVFYKIYNEVIIEELPPKSIKNHYSLASKTKLR